MEIEQYRQRMETAFKARIKMYQEENTNIDLMSTRYSDMLETLGVILEVNTESRIFSKEEIGSLEKYIKAMIARAKRFHSSNMVRIETIQESIKALNMADVPEPKVAKPPTEPPIKAEIEDLDEDAPDFDSMEDL